MQKDIVKQHNAITKARYDMSAAEKNVFYLLLSQIKEKGFHEATYDISVKELAKIQGCEIDHLQFKSTANKILDQVLSVPLGNERFKEINLVSSSEYVRGSGAIILSISDEIREFLVDLKNKFTQFNLEVGLRLKSKYSKRMYEMISQYKDTGFMVINIDELKHRLYLIDSQSGKDKYPIYGLLKKKVLEVAQKELQEKADTWFTYEAKKEGNKYTLLSFKIFSKKNAGELSSLTHDQNNGHTDTHTKNQEPSEISSEKHEPRRKLIEKFKLSPWQAEKILQKVPVKEIHKTTYSIQLDVLSNRVKNIGGYTAKIFDQKYDLELFKSK